MKRGNNILFLSIVFIILLIIGWPTTRHEGVTFISKEYENNLEKKSLLINLHEEFILGKEPLIFSKVVYDLDSITFAYKSNNVLSEMNILISGNTEDQNKTIKIVPISMNVPPGSYIVGDSYHVITVPNNLKLEQLCLAS